MALVNTLQPIPISNNTLNNTMNSHPQINSDILLGANKYQKPSLIKIQELLHHLFVRNRNQHRRNHWFKSLQQFRKQLDLLMEELEGEEKRKGSRKEKLDARLRLWDERCIHQWYL
jgi:ribonuclease MRP protein subunit RMP1